MSQVISTNIASLNAQRNLNSSQANLQTSLQRLSSGLRINSAKDDAAGLAITERMSSQIRGLNQAARNANDAISMSQTAEGNLTEISNVLQRMREIAVQSSSDSNTQADRNSLQLEVSQLTLEINRISASAQFNGKNLLDGTFGTASFQVGANAGQTISLSIGNASTLSLGLGSAITTSSASSTSTIANAGGMTLGGVTIGASVTDGVSYVGGLKDDTTGTSSALSLANAINLQKTASGVSAIAKTEITSAAVDGSEILAGTLKINGVDIGGVVAGAADATGLIAQINLKSSQTGVTAEAVSSDAAMYKLVAADGRNIDVSAGDLDKTGLDVSTTYGQVTITGHSDYAVSNGVAGIVNGTYQATGGPDVTTGISAGESITILDAALSQINSQRAVLGTIQSRFDSVISNLQTTSENLSAARSRIRDTDFAAETASLTRNQILQQAGVAMLAQANALPSSVLALLK